MSEIKKINEKDVEAGVYRSPESGLEAIAQDQLIAKAFLESGMEFVRSLEDEKKRATEAKEAENAKDARIAELEQQLAAVNKKQAEPKASASDKGIK